MDNKMTIYEKAIESIESLGTIINTISYVRGEQKVVDHEEESAKSALMMIISKTVESLRSLNLKGSFSVGKYHLFSSAGLKEWRLYYIGDHFNDFKVSGNAFEIEAKFFNLEKMDLVQLYAIVMTLPDLLKRIAVIIAGQTKDMVELVSEVNKTLDNFSTKGVL